MLTGSADPSPAVRSASAAGQARLLIRERDRTNGKGMPFAMRSPVDAEAYIQISRHDLVPLVDPVWRREVEVPHGINEQPGSGVLTTDVGDPVVGRRIRPPVPGETVEVPARVVYPDQLAGLGLSPHHNLHAALAEAYARWLTEQYLPQHPDARGMLYLPAVDPGACLRIVQRYGDRPRIKGAYLTTNATLEPHDNRLVPVYAELQDRSLVLAFQPTPRWPDSPFSSLDHYLAFWAFASPAHQWFTAVNWVFHGMPERFPRLRCVFCGGGLAWVHFLAHRLDREFLMRPSEAPMLKERPSHYFRRFFYTTYPLERVRDEKYMESIVRLVGSGQLLYGSGFPHWDFDGPDVVRRLSFLNSDEQRAVVGGNAARLFGFDGDEEVEP